MLSAVTAVEGAALAPGANDIWRLMMTRIWIAAAACIGLLAPSFAQSRPSEGAIRLAQNQGTPSAGTAVPIPEGKTGGRSGTPQGSQYKVKKKVKKAH